MSYDPTIWKSGDVVTSAKLNKIEKGIEDAGSGGGGGGGVLIVGIDMATMTLDKTYAEIASAGFAVLSALGDAGLYMVGPLTLYGVDDGVYKVQFTMGNSSVPFTTDSEDGYPSAGG